MKKLLAFLLVLVMLGGFAYANVSTSPDQPDGPIPSGQPQPMLD